MTQYKTLVTGVAMAAAALTLALPAFAQNTDMAASAAKGMSSGSAALKGGDRSFAMEAAKGGMKEVALGKLAQEKGSSDAVKQFGQKMVDDHTKANDELMQIASSKGLTLPAAPPKDAKMQKLESMSGDAFDKAYMAEMVADHKKTVALFEKESRSGSDADLKAFAMKTLPTVKSHLEMLQSHGAGGMMKH